MDPFVGEIRLYGFNFAPKGWALCQGQLMPIAQNTALFALLGTQYGGDGRSTFGLPNLQGCIANSFGQGPGLSPYLQGETGGTASVTLLSSQMPAHVHTLGVTGTAVNKTAAPGSTTVLGPTGQRGAALNVYDTAAGQSGNSVAMLATAVQPAGGNQPHNNMAPYLVLNYCIALSGVFPPRP